jgi:hypothetical protein
MTGVDHIVPCAGQQLAETEGTLIYEPSQRHLAGCLSGGPRQAQLEAQSLLHLIDGEFEEVSDRLSGLAGTELLGNHVGGHCPHNRSPVLMQRIERHQPAEPDRNNSICLGVGVADIPQITDETFHWSRHHCLPTADHDKHLVACDAHLALDVANKLAPVDVEKRPGVSERILTELLTQPDHRGTQPVHGRTAGAKLGEQPRLDDSPQVTSSSRVRSARTTGR